MQANDVEQHPVARSVLLHLATGLIYLDLTKHLLLKSIGLPGLLTYVICHRKRPLLEQSFVVNQNLSSDRCTLD